MPTPLPLVIKLEKALTAYLRANGGPRLKSLGAKGIVEGHGSFEPEMPYLVCYVTGAKPWGDMPPETGIRQCDAIFHLKTEGNDEERAKADGRLAELEAVLLAPLADDQPLGDENPQGGPLLLALNKPLTGPDARLQKPLHVYHFSAADESDSYEGDAWHDQRTFQIIAQPMDSH